MTGLKNTRYIGRQQEIQQLMEFARNALSGKGGVIFVTGEAGIGKSALVKEVWRALREEAPPRIFAFGQCHNASATFLPFCQIVEDLLTPGAPFDVKDAALKVIREIGSDVVNVFFPSDAAAIIANALPAIPSIAEPADLEQMQVFGWYAQMLKAVAQHVPLVVCLEDMHAADMSSLNLLLHLGRELDGARVCIIVTLLTHDTPAEILFKQIRHTLERVHLFSRYSGKVGTGKLLERITAELQGYGAQELSLSALKKTPKELEKAAHFVHDYLLASYGTNFSDRFEHFLVTRTAGNPLFLKEMLKNFEEKGQIAATVSHVAPDSFWRLSSIIERIEGFFEKIEHVTEERVGRIDGELRTILDAASVCGSEWSAELLARVLECDESRLLATIADTFVAAHDLFEDRGTRTLPDGRVLHRFSFCHALIRDEVYAHVAAAEKASLHARIGEQLERMFPDDARDIAADLAWHFCHAHVAGKAVSYCLKAAKNANARYGASEALYFGEMGLEMLRAHVGEFAEQVSADSQWRLVLELSKAAEAMGDREDESERLRMGIAYVEDHLPVAHLADEQLRADVYAQLGKLYYRQGVNMPEAIRYCEMALDIYERRDQKMPMFQTLYQLANVYPYVRETDALPTPHEKSIEVFEKCLSLAEQLRDIPLQVRCASSLSVKLIGIDFTQAERYARQALSLANTPETCDAYVLIKALNAMAAACRENGKFLTGIRYLEHALERAKILGDVLLEAAISNDLGFDYGRYINFQPQAQAALENSLAIRMRVEVSQSATLANLGWMLTRQGKWREAEAHFRKALIASNERSEAIYRGNIGRLYELQENYAQAEMEFLYRLEVLEKYRDARNLFGYTELTLNYALLGDEEQSRRYMEVARTLYEHENRPRRKWWCLYEIADGHRMLGAFNAAKSACQQSLKWFTEEVEDAENVLYLAEARLVMGKILVDTGSYEDALAFLEHARAALERCQHYALGDALLYLGKAYQGRENHAAAREYLTRAIGEFQRLELHHKQREAEVARQRPEQ